MSNNAAEQFLKSAKKLQKVGGRGFTVREMCAETGMGEGLVRKSLARLINAGDAKCIGTKMMKSISGVHRHAPAYEMIEAKRRK